MKISILLPTYNRANILLETIESVRRQDFQNYEILVWDDCSQDDTETKVRELDNDRINYHKNDARLGYGRNLESCREQATGEIIFLLGDDDVLLSGALRRTHDSFLRGEHIGLVTRPYYWFWEDHRIPIRTILPYDSAKDSEISIFDGKREIAALYRSAGQLSGLAFRRKYIDVSFHHDVFPAHVYPFTSILKQYKALYLKDFTIAVRTPLSISSLRPDVYDLSPVESWARMFETLLPGRGYLVTRANCIRFITQETYSGLFQIRTATSSPSKVLREIKMILRYDPASSKRPEFYAISIVAILTPGRVLRKIVDWYKVNLLSRKAIEAIGNAKLQA